MNCYYYYNIILEHLCLSQDLIKNFLYRDTENDFLNDF
jgi:hypothetical protein